MSIKNIQEMSVVFESKSHNLRQNGYSDMSAWKKSHEKKSKFEV